MFFLCVLFLFFILSKFPNSHSPVQCSSLSETSNDRKKERLAPILQLQVSTIDCIDESYLPRFLAIDLVGPVKSTVQNRFDI